MLEDRTAISWQYGTPFWYDIPDELMQQLRLVHELYNHLVEQERWYQSQVQELWLTIPSVKSAWADLEIAQERLTAIRTSAKETRKQDRTTEPLPEDVENMATARAWVRQARAAWKQARKDVRDEFKILETPLRGEYQCRTRTTGKCPTSNIYCLGGDHVYAVWTGKGLSSSLVGPTGRWWNTTRQAVISRRTAGEVADMHFRKWNGGECPLRIQIQPAPGNLHDSKICILDCTDWQGKIPPSSKRAAMYKVLRVKIGSSKTTSLFIVDIPFIMHRPFPEGAQITWLQIVRRTTAGRPRISIMFTLSVPKKKTEEVPVKDRRTVSLRTQWTSVEDGHIKIGTLGIARGKIPQPPDNIAKCVIIEPDGKVANLVASADWRKVLERGDRIREIRDFEFNKIKILTGDPDAIRWRNPGRLVSWMRENPDHGPLFTEWYHRNHHLWQYEAHERTQIINHKKWVYRNISSWICSFATRILVSDVDVKKLKQKGDVDQEDSFIERASRRNVQWSAPAEFRALLIEAATTRALEIEIENSTRNDH